MSKPSITQDQIEQLKSNLEQEIIEIEEELKWLQGDGEKIQKAELLQKVLKKKVAERDSGQKGKKGAKPKVVGEELYDELDQKEKEFKDLEEAVKEAVKKENEKYKEELRNKLDADILARQNDEITEVQASNDEIKKLKAAIKDRTEALEEELGSDVAKVSAAQYKKYSFEQQQAELNKVPEVRALRQGLQEIDPIFKYRGFIESCEKSSVNKKNIDTTLKDISKRNNNFKSYRDSLRQSASRTAVEEVYLETLEELSKISTEDDPAMGLKMFRDDLAKNKHVFVSMKAINKADPADVLIDDVKDAMVELVPGYRAADGYTLYDLEEGLRRYRDLITYPSKAKSAAGPLLDAMNAVKALEGLNPAVVIADNQEVDLTVATKMLDNCFPPVRGTKPVIPENPVGVPAALELPEMTNAVKAIINSDPNQIVANRNFTTGLGVISNIQNDAFGYPVVYDGRQCADFNTLAAAMRANDSADLPVGILAADRAAIIALDDVHKGNAALALKEAQVVVLGRVTDAGKNAGADAIRSTNAVVAAIRDADNAHAGNFAAGLTAINAVLGNPTVIGTGGSYPDFNDLALAVEAARVAGGFRHLANAAAAGITQSIYNAILAAYTDNNVDAELAFKSAQVAVLGQVTDARKNAGANRFVSNLSAIDLKREDQEKLKNFVEKVVLLDPRFNLLHGATQENFDEGMRRFRSQFDADYTRANPDVIKDINGVSTSAELKTKYKDVIEAAKMVGGDYTKVNEASANDIVNVMRVIDENFPVPHALPQKIDASAIGGRLAGPVGKMFNSKEQKLLDSLDEYNHHLPASVAYRDDISAAFREIKGRVDGGLDNKGVGSTIRPTAATVAFTAAETAILDALNTHTAGNIGAALKTVDNLVEGGLDQHIAGGKVVKKDGTDLAANELAVITALENYVPGSIGKALEIMQERVQGGLNQAIGNKAAASTNAFTAHESKFIYALGDYGAGIDGQSNVGKGFKQFKSRVTDIDADTAVIKYAAAAPKLGKVTTLTGEEKEAKIEEVLGLLGVLGGAARGGVPTEVQIQVGLDALTNGASAAGHKGQNQLSDYLNHEKPKLAFGRKQIFGAKDAADGTQKEAIEAIAKLSSDGNPDNGLAELKMVLARKYSDQISLRDSVAAIDQSNLEIVKNHQKLRRVKQEKNKEFSDRGIDGRDGLINGEIDEVLKDEISSDPRLVALNRQLEEQERILSEKQKKLNGRKRHIDELIDNSPEVQVKNKVLKKAKEDLDAFKVYWMDQAEKSLISVDPGNSLLNSVESDAKQNTEDKERINAIFKARTAELKNLQDIDLKYNEYNNTVQSEEKQRIAGEIDKLLGNENHDDEFSDRMPVTGKEMANLLFDAKGDLDKQAKKSTIEGVFKEFSGNRQLKSRAEKVFGPLLRKDAAAGRLEDFIDNVEKALKEDLSKAETPKRLQNLLETGSKDSQAFYQAMFHEVVLKKMPDEQRECFIQRAIVEGDIPADDKRKDLARKFVAESSVAVDPQENSVYDLWYKNAKRGGHLTDLSERNIEMKAKVEANAPKGNRDADGDENDLGNKAAAKIQAARRGSNTREALRKDRSLFSKGDDEDVGNSPPNQLRSNSGNSSGLSGPSYEQVRDSGKPTSQLNPDELMAVVSRAVEEAFNRRSMFSSMTQGSHMSSAPAVQGYSPGQPLFYQGAGGQFMQLPAQQQAFAPNPFPPQGYGYGQPSYQQGGYYAPQFSPFAPPMQGGAPYYPQPQFYPYPPQMQGGYPSPNMDEITKEVMDNISRRDAGAVNNSASRNTSSSSSSRDQSESSGRDVSPSRLENFEEDGRSGVNKKELPVTTGGATIEQIKVSNVAKDLLVPQILGDVDGANRHPAKVLNNGLVVIQYGDISNFNNHVKNAINSYGTSLSDKKSKNLISIVEIADSEDRHSSLYKVVVSDERGVKVHDINKETYQKITNQNKKSSTTLSGEERVKEMDDIMGQISREFCGHKSKMDEKMKELLLDRCKNTLVENVPFINKRVGLSGRYGGRKDKLKALMDHAAFTYTGGNKDENGNLISVENDRQEIVIERDRLRQNRVTVTINGDPEKDAFVSIGNGCHVKVKADGEVVPDKIYRTCKGGVVDVIDVGGDFFDNFSLRDSPLVKSLLGDNKRSDAKMQARQIMKNYNNLELIVCKNGNKDVGLSFMIDGKTHGMELTKRELAAGVVVAGIAATVAGVMTGGLAVAAVAAAGTGAGAGAGAALSAGQIGGLVTGGTISAAGGGLAYITNPNSSFEPIEATKLQDRFKNLTTVNKSKQL